MKSTLSSTFHQYPDTAQWSQSKSNRERGSCWQNCLLNPQIAVRCLIFLCSKPQQESIFEPQKKIPLQLSLSSPFPSDIMGRSSYHWPCLSMQFNGLFEHLFQSSHWLIAKAKLVMNLTLCSRFLPWVTNEKKIVMMQWVFHVHFLLN